MRRYRIISRTLPRRVGFVHWPHSWSWTYLNNRNGRERAYNCLIIITTYCILVADEESDEEFSWKDYTYIEAVKRFYKIHTAPQNWFHAKLECEEEGASLFYPENDDEQNAVMSFRNTTQPDVKWVFMGISDLSSEGVFQTVDGAYLPNNMYNARFIYNWITDDILTAYYINVFVFSIQKVLSTHSEVLIIWFQNCFHGFFYSLFRTHLHILLRSSFLPHQ